jgi:hypothetical protein
MDQSYWRRKMKVSELEGRTLDLWVAKAEGHMIATHKQGDTVVGYSLYFYSGDTPRLPDYSTDWADGGPVIEKAAIGWRNRGATSHVGAHKGLSSVEGQPWEAWFCDGGDEGGNGFLDRVQTGKTLLIASMRAFVASKYGEEVPDAGEKE